MWYPVKEVYALSDIWLLKVDQNNEKTQKKWPSSPRVNPDARQDKWETQLWQAVKKAKENGRVHYIHRSEKAMQSVLEWKEFVSEGGRGVSLARFKKSVWWICNVSDGHDLFPVHTEKNEPLSESMKSFVAQIKPERFMPIRFWMSHSGNKKATRDTDFCDLIESFSTYASPQKYDGKEYHDGLIVGFDLQLNPLVYSSFDRKIYIVKDTVLWENIYGDFVLLDYRGEDNVVSVLRHTQETHAVRAQEIHDRAREFYESLSEPWDKEKEVKEENSIKQKEVISQNDEIQSTESVDQKFLWAIEGLWTAAWMNDIWVNEEIKEVVVAEEQSDNAISEPKKSNKELWEKIEWDNKNETDQVKHTNKQNENTSTYYQKKIQRITDIINQEVTRRRENHPHITWSKYYRLKK